MKPNSELNLRDLFLIFRRRFNFIVLVTVSAVLICFLGTKLLIAPTYEDERSVYVDDRTSSVNDTKNISDIFPIIIKNHTILSKVIENLGIHENIGDLTDRISVKVVSTNVYVIKVTDSDPARAQSIADSVVSLAAEEISNILYIDGIRIVTLSHRTAYVSPDILNNVVTAFFSGLVISCVIIIVRELVNNKFKTADDIRSLLDYEVIAVIPKRETPGRLARQLNKYSRLIFGKAVFSDGDRTLESYNILRFNVCQNQSAKKILIASPLTNEGKTTVAVSLAASLGSLGKNVLLIEADLRNPILCKHLGLSPYSNGGLSGVLAGKYAAADTVVRFADLKFDVLPSGPDRSGVNELLQSPDMKNLIEALEAKYDYIIFDTPALSGCADAATLFPLADGVILVIRQNLTTFEAGAFAKNCLEAGKAAVTGCVLNAFDLRKTNKAAHYFDFKDVIR